MTDEEQCDRPRRPGLPSDAVNDIIRAVWGPKLDEINRNIIRSNHRINSGCSARCAQAGDWVERGPRGRLRHRRADQHLPEAGNGVLGEVGDLRRDQRSQHDQSSDAHAAAVDATR